MSTSESEGELLLSTTHPELDDFAEKSSPDWSWCRYRRAATVTGGRLGGLAAWRLRRPAGCQTCWAHQSFRRAPRLPTPARTHNWPIVSLITYSGTTNTIDITDKS